MNLDRTANVLAQEFGLPVPEMCLVKFTPEFIDFALENEERKFLAKKDPGLKFASKLEDRLSIVAPSLYSKYLKEYDIANVFAFDCLIYNLDRGGHRNKPNLLVDDENFILIDHEQIFPFADNSEAYFKSVLDSFNQDKTLYPFQKHLLFPYLKNFRTQNKKHLFDEFAEYLTRFNDEKLTLTIRFDLLLAKPKEKNLFKAHDNAVKLLEKPNHVKLIEENELKDYSAKTAHAIS